MGYSIEPKDRIYVKGYRLLSFAKNISIHATKTAKSISNNIVKKFLIVLKNREQMQ